VLKKKNILYIVHNYNSFQKDSIEEAAKYFKNVYVLVRYKPISKYVKKIPIKWLKKYDDSYVIDLRNLPSNVKVFKTPVWYLPYGIFYKWLGKLHYKSVEAVIEKYNIKFDIVHSHFIWSSGYVGMRIKEKYHVPFVVTGHGFDVYSLPFKSKRWAKMIKEILNNADKVLTVSNKNKEILQKIGLIENICVIPNGYNSNIFFQIEKDIARQKLGINKESKVLLTIGGLVKVKGQRYLIEAVKELFATQPQILCYVIGGGPLEVKLRKLIKEVNLEKKIILLGHLPHEEINMWMNSCDVFVLPSLSESFGIVQLEAFACGKPVVATKNEGSRQVITSDNLGFLCNIEDPESLAETISKALEKKWNEKEIMKHAESFTWDNVLTKVQEIYNDLLKK